MAEISPSSDGTPSLRRTPPLQPSSEPNKSIPFWTPDSSSMTPAIAILNPSAYGASWKQMGVGVGYQSRTRFTNNDDGTFGVAFGLGNPEKYLGVEVGLGLTDISNTFADGRLNLKLHRRLPDDFNLAVGVQGVTSWGETDGGSSVYGVLTKKFNLQSSPKDFFSELFLTVGIGGGQFRSEDDILKGVDSVGIFGGASLRVIEQVNFISEWSGQDLSLGFSIVPFKNIPLVFTPAVTDITETAGDGSRFILGVGYQINF